VRSSDRLLLDIRLILRSATRWFGPTSALIVPVSAAEPVLSEWAGYPFKFAGASPHVTIMYPFLPAHRIDRAALQEIADLVADIRPFPFSLTHIAHFPNVYYLAPQPATPFLRLTSAVQSRWPECRPYRGAYRKVEPHVAIALTDHPPADLVDLARRLPIATVATEVWLIQHHVRGWRTRARFLFGTDGTPTPLQGPGTDSVPAAASGGAPVDTAQTAPLEQAPPTTSGFNGWTRDIEILSVGIRSG
jgi:2'-5' RNA ligase